MDGTTNLNNTGPGVPNWGTTGQPPLQTGGPTGSGNAAMIGTNPDGTPVDVVESRYVVGAMYGNDPFETIARVDEGVIETFNSLTGETIMRPIPPRAVVQPYVTYSSDPLLQQSTVHDPALANTAINLIQNPPPETQEALFTTFVTNIIPDLGTEGSETRDVTDPQILQKARETGADPVTVQNNVLFDQNSRFATLVSTYPEDIANKLTFANFVPEGAENLSPELKAELASIQKQVKEGVANAFGFTEDWSGIPNDASEFVQKLTNQADFDLEKLLDAKVADGSLSAADAQTLRSMHYGLATGTPTLKNLLITLQNQSIATLQSKFGMDAAYMPKPDVVFYNNVVNGDFAQTFKKKVDAYIDSKATAEQKDLLKQYESKIQADPNDPSIPASIRGLVEQQQLLLKSFPNPDTAGLPDDLKSVAKGLIAAATAATIEKYGLDTTWKPTITVLMSPTADVAFINKAQADINMANDLVDQATQLANQLPDGPEKEQFLAFLKVISKALSALQETLYAMQAGQSNASRNANRGKLDLALNDLEQQKKAAEKSEKNVKKMVAMGPAGKAIMWIIKIILLLISVWFGPAAIMLAMALIMDQVVSDAMGSKKTGLEKTMDAMTENLPPAAAAALKLIMIALVAVVSPWLAVYLLTSESHAVEDIMKSTGASKEAQAIASMVINLVLGLVIMVPMMIATGGVAAAYIGKIVADLATTTVRLVQLMVFLISQIPTLISIALEGVKINNNILLAMNDMIKGESEAMSEKIQGIIKLLKELIAKLMEILSGTSANIVSINEFQGSKWTSANQLSSEIFG